MVNGIVNVYKEKGFTSFDVVAKMRGIFHQKKIGHTGTLDPDAEGVLPVCLGSATKGCELLTDKDKEYEAENPLKEGGYKVVLEKSGWENTSEILDKLPDLEGNYTLYFELKDEKWTYNDFCVVVISIVQDRNKDRNLNIRCTRRRSKDGRKEIKSMSSRFIWRTSYTFIYVEAFLAG